MSFHPPQNVHPCKGCGQPIQDEYALVNRQPFHFVDDGPSCYHEYVFPWWPSRAVERGDITEIMLGASS